MTAYVVEVGMLDERRPDALGIRLRISEGNFVSLPATMEECRRAALSLGANVPVVVELELAETK